MICERVTSRRLGRSALAAVLGLIGTLLSGAPSAGQSVQGAPSVVMGDLPFTLSLGGADGISTFYEVRTAGGRLLGSGVIDPGATLEVGDLRVSSRDELPLTVQVGSTTHSLEASYAPGWFSLVPPLVAILLALVFREVVSALFAGVWLGAHAVAGYNPLAAVWRVVDRYAVPALANAEDGQTQIVVFSLLLGGMVGVIAKNGGTRGIVEALRPLATSARRGKLATWAAGLAIFFDDYANTLLVGNTMRPITDRLRISREKLAYIVDSTAAPVAAIVPISTWVGYEISLIGGGLGIAASQQMATNPELAASLADANAFTVFLHTIPYLFYPLLAIAFVFLTSVMNRDLGAMAQAEHRAEGGGGLFRPGAMLAADPQGEMLEPPEDAPRRWLNAALPVLAVIVIVLMGLLATGRTGAGPDATVWEVFGEADAFSSLLWGSLGGGIVAIALSVGQRILGLRESIEAWVGGMKAMLIAVVILVLAWSLGAVTKDVGTAAYLSQILEGQLSLQLLPALVFVTSAGMAFATGTSWTTMAIMLPLVIPLTVSLGGGVAFDGGAHYSILLGSISSVLAGAIFGDHCSPISDTTVLSSMASGCDHIDHVRTQLPYAVLVAVIGLLLGDLGTAYGLPNWIALLAGVAILFVVLRLFGVPTGEGAGTAAGARAAPVAVEGTPETG